MARLSDGTKPNVAWWTVVLLFLLGSVLAGLFIAARLLLSLEREPLANLSTAPVVAQTAAFDAGTSSTASSAAALSKVS